jgi:hypothetical protein
MSEVVEAMEDVHELHKPESALINPTSGANGWLTRLALRGLNITGALPESRWSDAALGANSEAAAALLLHYGPLASPLRARHFFVALRLSLQHAINTNMVEALAGIMGPVEVLCLAALGEESTTRAQQAALSVVMDLASGEWRQWESAAAPDEAQVERLLALAGAIARLCVLFPNALARLEMSAKSHRRSSDHVVNQLLQVADFLGRTAQEHRSVERTQAWAWHAVDPERASAADAEKAVAATAAADAKAIPIRRHLLRCLAGPVTHLSLHEESDILSLTRPTIALRAHVAWLRLKRAATVFGAPQLLAQAVGPARDPSTYRATNGPAVDLAALFQ